MTFSRSVRASSTSRGADTLAERAVVCDQAIDVELMKFKQSRATVEDNFAPALIAEVVKDLQSEEPPCTR
jgi:hypothetical protein